MPQVEDEWDGMDPVVARELRRDTAAEWIRKKSTPAGRQCPVCQTSVWTVTDVQEVPPLARVVAAADGLVIPVFLLVCDNCGFCRMFNAIKSGVLREKP
jgi:C4-type Zn-finger protein